MISPVRHIGLKRILEIFLSYTPLTFYQQPLHDLDDGISENLIKYKALKGGDFLPKDSNGVLDFINKKYDLEKEPDRRKAHLLIASLEASRKGFQNFFYKSEKNSLSTEIKGEIFWMYLRLYINDFRLFLHTLTLNKEE